MIDFSDWTKKDAAAYRDAYVAAVPLRASWLAAEVQASGGEAAFGGPARLDALWNWTTRRFDDEGATGLELRVPLPADDPQRGPRPPWHDPDRPNPYLSDGALWVIEGLGCHLAVLVLEACPDTGWDLYRAPAGARDVNQNRTMLHGLPDGRPADPSSMVYGQVIRTVIHGEPWAPAALAGLYRSMIEAP